MSNRALLLINRHARRGADRVEHVVAKLKTLGLELIEESSQHPERLPQVIRDHSGRIDLVIVGGGDGTLSAAAEGLIETGLPLGILPLGTANNTARTLGIPSDLDEACHVIAVGHRRRIDLGRVNDKHFFTTASLGLNVDITQRLSRKTKRRWGTLAYVMTAARVAWQARPFNAELRWEGGSLTTRTVQIVVGNGRHYGNALTVAGDADIDDGWLDVYSLERHGWWQLVGIAPALKRGDHGEKPDVQTLRVRELDIVTAVPRRIGVDGELHSHTPAHFSVARHALAVFVPIRI